MRRIHAAQMECFVTSNALNTHWTNRWTIASTALDAFVSRTIELVWFTTFNKAHQLGINGLEAISMEEPPAIRPCTFFDE
jgi:hypothetical protein